MRDPYTKVVIGGDFNRHNPLGRQPHQQYVEAGRERANHRSADVGVLAEPALGGGAGCIRHKVTGEVSLCIARLGISQQQGYPQKYDKYRLLREATRRRCAWTRTFSSAALPEAETNSPSHPDLYFSSAGNVIKAVTLCRGCANLGNLIKTG